MTGYDLGHSQDLEHALETRWPTADDRLHEATGAGLVGEVIGRIEEHTLEGPWIVALLQALDRAGFRT